MSDPEKRRETMRALMECEQWADSLSIASELVQSNFDDVEACFACAQSLTHLKRYGAAALIYESVARRAPGLGFVYGNLGACQVETDPERALENFLKAYEITPDLKNTSNLAAAYQSLGQYDKALEMAESALQIDPNDPEANWNSAFTLLILGEWEEGWRRYRYALGNKFREEKEYHADATPRWIPGLQRGGTVAIYGEQGLGDEILYASMLQNVKGAGADEIILHIDPRLAGLFGRSFPWATIGDRRAEWEDWHERVTHKLEIGGLGEFYAPTPFRAGGFLKADPLRKVQYRALLDHLGEKPKIGIAWWGGSPNTGQAHRSIPMEQLRPLLEAVDAEWVSLEYEDHGDRPPFVHDFPWATKSSDYDDTAALVDELDLVISATTTLVDLCGALGKECWALVPKVAPWRYGHEGGQMYFYDSVRVFRQDKDANDWCGVIGEVQKCLSARNT